MAIHLWKEVYHERNIEGGMKNCEMSGEGTWILSVVKWLQPQQDRLLTGHNKADYPLSVRIKQACSLLTALEEHLCRNSL